MEILALLKIIDISGVLIGVIWFLHWLLKEQKIIVFYRGMSAGRVWTFFRELVVSFATKAFGKVSAGVLSGGFAFAGGFSGRLISRYAIVGGASELTAGSIGHEKAAIIAFTILVSLMLAQIWWEVYKNRKLLEDWKSLGKIFLESYIVFGVVGLLTSFYL